MPIALAPLELDAATCFRAVRARDGRFDGRFFTAVRTTGIFCRPICPARTPLRRNVTFYASAAAALAAGYRPCLRCRPELAPERRRVSDHGALVAAALDCMDRGGETSLVALSAHVGVSSRHLRRIFLAELGATPVQVAQSRRALFARQLLRDTTLPITRIAFAAGFASVRRFNTAMRGAYGCAPTALRRATAPASPGPAIELRVDVTRPYAAAGLLAFLLARAFPGVEAVDGTSYARAFALGGGHGVVQVQFASVRRARGVVLARREDQAITLRILANEKLDLAPVVARVRRMFDTAADTNVISTDLAHDPALAPLVRRCRGIRVPGAWDPFEVAVRAIVGQQVSVKAATTLAARLVLHFGSPLEPALAAASGLTRLFPTPESLAGPRAAEAIGRLGIVRARAAAIVNLARAMLADPRLFDAPTGLEDFIARLVTLPGIGRWTAQYIAMRATGDPDAFPEGDLALVRAYSRLAGRDVEKHELTACAERWRPWRAYAALMLWQGAAAWRAKPPLELPVRHPVRRTRPAMALTSDSESP